MEPKLIQGQNDLAEKWKKVLEALIPDSIVEIHGVKETGLFTWFFTTELRSGFKQSVQMIFLKKGGVNVETQSGTGLAELDSFEEAEKWILEYFDVPTKSQPEPEKILAGLPNLKERQEAYQKWEECLEKLKPYGVEVYTESEYRPFSLYLPTIESVMRNDGKFETKDDSVDLDQGDDWAKVIIENVIPKLKEIYDLSISGIPDFSEDLKIVKLSDQQKKLYPILNPWIEYFEEVSKNVPFKMFCRDLWTSISSVRCHFDGEKIVEGVLNGQKHGIFSIPFEYECTFGVGTFPVTIFSGKLTFFEENTAVLEFSGTSMWGLRYIKEGNQFHLQGRYAGGRGSGHNAKDINKKFLSGTWVEVTNEFNSLVAEIIELFGTAMELQPEVLKASKV